jgi:hypothetical protein
MRKYLEFFENGFDETIDEKIKPENGPYVGYSPTEHFRFTTIYKRATKPASNEIWYTSTDEQIVNPENSSMFGSNLINNIYTDGQGVLTFEGPITEIAGNAFFYCDTIASIIIPEGVTTFNDSSFYEAHNIQSIVIPSTVTRIGHGSFFNCTSLDNITFNGTMEQWNNMSKGQSWKYNMKTSTIHCKDGDITL